MPDEELLTQEEGELLLRLARHEIGMRFGLGGMPPDCSGRLMRSGASFVTLTLHGSLRGCIGSLEAHRPLEEDVRCNARVAAFSDPRFSMLGAEAFRDVCVEVSVLSDPRKLPPMREAELLKMLRPGVDGVVLSCGMQRGTFLPQVWESLPEPRMFLNALKRKAGLPADACADDMVVSIYTVQKWREGGVS